jgi:predicted small metal-binding protein
MAYKLMCADSGAKCPFEVQTESKDELMQHVALHAKMSHPELASNPPTPAQIEKMIHQV